MPQLCTGGGALGLSRNQSPQERALLSPLPGEVRRRTEQGLRSFDPVRKIRSSPVKVVYECMGRCKPKRGERPHNDGPGTKKGRYFLDFDLAKLAAIEASAIPHWFPLRKMMDIEDDSKPWGEKWRAGTSNFRSVAELYTKRNLWALAALKHGIDEVTDGLHPAHIVRTVPSLTCSRMLRENGAIQAGTYYIPMESRQISVQNAFQYGTRIVVAGQQQLSARGESAANLVSNGSALVDTAHMLSVVDYIFTDPAYVGKVQYGELNFVWESWLGFGAGWLSDELIVNPFRNKSLDDWDCGLRKALANCFPSPQARAMAIPLLPRH